MLIKAQSVVPKGSKLIAYYRGKIPRINIHGKKRFRKALTVIFRKEGKLYRTVV